MVPCISYSPDILPTNTTTTTTILNISKQHQTRKRRLNSREALLHLDLYSNTLKRLKQIHAQIIRNHLTHSQLLLANLIRVYPLHYATLVFHQIPHPTTFTWNLIIRTHTIHNSSYQALLLYNLMLTHPVSPDKFTFPFVIKACSLSSALPTGKVVHSLAIKSGFSRDLFLENVLMDFYFKCGDVDNGQMVFDKMRVRSVVSWTTMLTGLLNCGELEAARGIFERMPVRNVVSWTAMINGYAKSRRPQEAFQLFREMQICNVVPNEFTLVGLLVACTELRSLSLGRRIHGVVEKKGFELGVFLGTALVDMYSKCGSVDDAKKVFDKMEKKSLATWNSMITSLGVHGRGAEALILFAQMEKENVRPDVITFFGVMCAFVQVGAVEEGCRYFRYMSEHYGITPAIEHYNCVVQLLCSVGMLDEAYRLVKIMPVTPNDDTWDVLLKESRNHGNTDIEKLVYRYVVDLHSTRASFDFSQNHNLDLNCNVG